MPIHRHSTNSILSGIPEEGCIQTRLHLAFIGQGASDVVQEIIEEANHKWGYDTQGGRHSGLSMGMRSCGRSSGRSSGRRGSVGSTIFTDNAPFGCKVAIDRAERSPWASEDSSPLGAYKHQPEDFDADAIRSEASCIRSESSDVLRVQKKFRCVVKLNMYPVEGFGDVIPQCNTMATLTTVYFVFLLDHRSDTSKDEMLHDLTRRFLEVQQTVKKFMKVHGLTDVPSVMVALLQHTLPRRKAEGSPRRSEGSPRRSGRAASKGTSDASLDGFGGLTPSQISMTSMGTSEASLDECEEHGTVGGFLEQLRSYGPSDMPIHFACDFGDRTSLFHTTMRIVTSLSKKRQSRDSEDPASPPLFHRPCLPFTCTVQ